MYIVLISKVLQGQIGSFQNTLKGQSNNRRKSLAFSPIQVANTGQLHGWCWLSLRTSLVTEKNDGIKFYLKLAPLG